MSHQNPLAATLSGLKDQLRPRVDIEPLSADVRLDGMTALITGANSGLGYATAEDLARRGARVIMACRSGIPEAGEQIAAATGATVEMRAVDLSDHDSIHAFADALRDDGVQIDVLVSNAGVMPRESRRTRHGLEWMFTVNYLAPFILVRRLVDDGVVRGTAGQPARIIFVASEAHRSAPPLDPDSVGVFVPYGLTDGLKHYGTTKLLLLSFAAELQRRLATDQPGAFCVHALCPGAVNSNMAREAPAWVKPLLAPVMRVFFRSPARAAEPVEFLAGSDVAGTWPWRYLHMMAIKEPREDALDPTKGARLWLATEALLDHLPPAET